MYKAILFFKDLHDKSFEYRPGDIFPRPGLEVSQERLDELASDKNRRGIPVIEKVMEAETVPEPVEAEITDSQKTEKPKRERKKKNAD